jgi:hypothetical protein
VLVGPARGRTFSAIRRVGHQPLPAGSARHGGNDKAASSRRKAAARPAVLAFGERLDHLTRMRTDASGATLDASESMRRWVDFFAVERQGLNYSAQRL